eukprot:TRINITY_DN5568_c0_g1_i4.p1 TRINITY_DN5568_c0_g1~~TRINITY_DN5568_c0_g1_i4.p1  ORF type:complete len:239 (-),score=68.83 TRINITY_DN5568_c0_g1_i4:86-778(-)
MGVDKNLIEMKLHDVPAMGYTSHDQPHPRGEIVVRSKVSAIPGYYKRPDLTADSVRDGWYYTGDIGMIDEQGKLHIIDRVKNVIDLYVDGRSVWVAVGQLETVYQASPWVHQIFLRGERDQEYLVAVIVLNSAAVADFLSRYGLPADSSPDTYLSDPRLRQEVLASLAEIAVAKGVQSYEKISGVVLEPPSHAWTVESGLLVGVGKVSRPSLLRKYRDVINQELIALSQH